MVRNIKSHVKGNILTLEIDLSKNCGPSASGKTLLVASTGKPVEVISGLFLGLNAYKYPEKA